MKLNAHAIYAKISPRFREERRRRFLELMRPSKEMRILDVGGYSGNWTNLGVESHVTLVNLHVTEADKLRDNLQFRFVEADGCDLPFEDNEFDLVYSNSVIEHLYTGENQKRFADEMRRVGKHYWVQTPAKEFPVEPHLLTPFIHWLPKRLQLMLAKWFTVRGWVRDETRPTRQSVYNLAEEVRLLSKKSVTQLFPEGELIVEKFMGFRKSYVVYTTTKNNV